MYHRIAALPYDPWGLAVSPTNFEAQLDCLRRCRTPMGLPEFVADLAAGRLSPDAVAITFDDGYVDNLRCAEPLLAAARLSATLFLITGSIGSSGPFWWDELAHMILAKADPADAAVTISGITYRIRFDSLNKVDRARQCWRAWEPPRTRRETAFLSFWNIIRSLGTVDREQAMEALRTALSASPPIPEDRPMNLEELQGLASRGTFVIGAHTVSHPVLPILPPDEQQWEIAEGRRAAEAMIGRPVPGFSYPYGAIDERVRAIVINCGFEWACSTAPTTINPAFYDRYSLSRLAAPPNGSDGLIQAIG